MAELNAAVYDLAMESTGSDALLFAGYDETRPDFAAVHGQRGDVRHDYLRSLANSIEGGTSEILRNILGERVFGLRPEPRLDKNIPWARALKSWARLRACSRSREAALGAPRHQHRSRLRPALNRRSPQRSRVRDR